MALNDKTRKHNDMDFQKDLSEILTNAKIGLWAIEMDEGKEPRMYFDDVAREITGFYEDMTPEECYERWYKRIVDSAIDSVQASVKEMIEQGKSENTYAWIHPKKGRIYTRCGGSLDENYTAGTRLWGYHQDVTENMQAAEIALQEAKRANAAKTTFLSRMSHDIRTPLNGIIGLLEIGERHPDDVELLRQNRAKEKIAANHLLSLINDILELSKIDSSRIELAHEAFDITELADEILTITAMKAAEAGITLVHGDCKDSMIHPYVYGSPLHVRQILLNILDNAVKYNVPGGSVHCSAEFVEMEAERAVYRCTVTDTGIGMSEKYMRHLFEPFSQEHYNEMSLYQGTGLGMPIVKSLIDRMHGKIEVRSEVGVGTTFTVTIPFEIAPESEVANNENENEEQVSLDNVKILLVEDNELNLDIAKYLLTDSGAQVTTVMNGDAAVREFQNTPVGTYDVILMDVMMPVMNGIDAAKTIRSLNRPDAKTLPIIAMTANAFYEDAQKCLAAGMNAHLAKPLQIKKVKQTIAEWVKNNRTAKKDA